VPSGHKTQRGRQKKQGEKGGQKAQKKSHRRPFPTEFENGGGGKKEVANGWDEIGKNTKKLLGPPDSGQFLGG